MNDKLINGMRGKDMYNNEDRAPKASITFELFRLAEDIAHIRNGKDSDWQISREQVDAIIAKAKATRKVTYAAIREAMGFKNNYEGFSFDYIRGPKPNIKKIKNYESLTPDEKLIAEIREHEKATFVQMDFYHAISTALKDNSEKFAELENSVELFDKVGEILTVNKDDESIKKSLREIGFSDKEIEPLLLLSFAKFGNLSLTTMRKAIPLMLDGKTYDKALEEIYPGQFAAKPSGDKTKLPPLNEQQSQEITNPVVKRAISQTIKVVNAVIRKYGLPTRIGVEAAGDLATQMNDYRMKIKKCLGKDTEQMVCEIIVRDGNIPVSNALCRLSAFFFMYRSTHMSLILPTGTR
jgi:CRISPR-associated endonuclease Csn1